MSEYRLVMKGVVKTFPGVKALDHAQLELRPGKVMALMGENGAGKSTLMKWMFGKYVSDPAQRGNDLMSPVRASAERLRGLPPTLIAVAENDILRDEGEAMGRRLDEAGVEVTTVRFNGVVHDWGMLNGFAALHPTRTLIRLAGSVLRDYLKK